MVDFLVERFGLPLAKREKVRRYYHQVESGRLAPSSHIREALGAVLGAPVQAWKPRPLAAEPVYFRALLAAPVPAA